MDKIKIISAIWKPTKTFGKTPYVLVEYKAWYFADKNGEVLGASNCSEVSISEEVFKSRSIEAATAAIVEFFSFFEIKNKSIPFEESISPDQWVRAQQIAKLQAKATELQAGISNLQNSLTAVEMELEVLMKKEMGSTGADPKKIQEALESENDAYYTHQYNKNGN